MNVDSFAVRGKKFSVVFLIQDQDLARWNADLERLGALPNVKLVVQPCPFEGIEFLYRVPLDLPEQAQSFDREVFWHALALPEATADHRFADFCARHYDFIVAILEQDARKVERERKALAAFTGSAKK